MQCYQWRLVCAGEEALQGHEGKGITVYTVGFDVADLPAAKDVMTKCATDATKLYIADDGEQLKQAFRDIALKLSSLYISK